MKTFALHRIEINGRRYKAGDELAGPDAAAAIERGWARSHSKKPGKGFPTEKIEHVPATTPVEDTMAFFGAPETK